MNAPAPAGRIHPTALVAPGATLHPTVEVGPFAVVGAHVVLGEGCQVMSHAVVEGRTTLGARNRVFPHAVIGMIPQDLKYAGQPTRFEAGDGNVFREFVTCHPGTGEAGVTRVGNDSLFMVGVHVAHDCSVGDGVVVSNAVGLAGHVSIGDHAVLGGMAGVHQHVRIGRYAMVGGASRIVADVPPFTTVEGAPAHVVSLNRIGLKRAPFDDAFRDRLDRAFRILFRSRMPLPRAVEALVRELGQEAPVAELVAFFSETRRGVTRPLRSRGGGEE